MLSPAYVPQPHYAPCSRTLHWNSAIIAAGSIEPVSSTGHCLVSQRIIDSGTPSGQPLGRASREETYPVNDETHPKPDLTQTQQTYLRIMGDLQSLFGEVTLNEQRNDLVRELDAAILRSTFSARDVLELIIEKCLKRTAADHGQIALYRGGQLVIVASSEPKRVGGVLLLPNSLCGKAVLERAEQHCPDVSLLPPGSYVRFHEETQSELVLPIQPANTARVLGVLDLERNALGDFPSTAMSFAHLLAGQAAIAIEHARIWNSVKTLNEINNVVAAGTLTLQQSCTTLLTTLLSGSDFEHGQILIREGDALLILASSREEDIGLRPGPESSICGRYLLAEQGREVLVINDMSSSQYRDVYLALLGAEGQMQSEMIVPLFSEHGALIGALNIESPYVDAFTAPDVSFFGVVGNFLAGAITATLARQKRSKEEQIKTNNLAMTRLGDAATSFVHHFRGSIGSARGRLLELSNHLAASDLPPLKARNNATPVEFIQGVVASLDEARNIIDDLKKRFHPEAVDYRFQNIDLAVIGSELVERYEAKWADAGIKITFENHLRVVPSAGNQSVGSSAVCRLTEKVNEVIENLIDNAVHAILERPDQSEPGKVTVSVALSDALTVQLRVTDNGVGIPENMRPHILKYGFTSREGKGGQGIGLSLCEHYVFQVGGRMTFDSVEGRGSWFEMEFPTIGT